jgi:hypothetical protein
MPATRLSMRKIREVLRLKWCKGLSNRKIASSSGIGRPTVSEYLRRATEAGLTWPLPADLDDSCLERLLFPPPPDLPALERGIPDWTHIHGELKHKGVTNFGDSLLNSILSIARAVSFILFLDSTACDKFSLLGFWAVYSIDTRRAHAVLFRDQ